MIGLTGSKALEARVKNVIRNTSGGRILQARI